MSELFCSNPHSLCDRISMEIDARGQVYLSNWDSYPSKNKQIDGIKWPVLGRETSGANLNLWMIHV